MTDAHPWLPIAKAAAWTGKAADDARLVQAREAAAAYCERQRPDLLLDAEGAVLEAAPADVVMAGLLATDRLIKAGRGTYGAEFGGAEVLAPVGEIARLLGIGAHAKPRVG